MKKQSPKAKNSPKNRKIKKKPEDIEQTKVDEKKPKQRSRSKSSKIKEESKPKQKKQRKKTVPKSKIVESKPEIVEPKPKTKSRSRDKITEQKKVMTTQSSDAIKTDQNQKKVKQQKGSLKSSKVMQKYRTKSIIEQLQNYSCELTMEKKYKIKMHGSYQIDESHKLYKHIETLFKLFIEKQKKKAENIFVQTRYSFFPVFEFLLSGEAIGEHKCCICQFQFQEPKDTAELQRLMLDVHDEDIVSLKCSHLLHLDCLKNLIGNKEWFKCPVCSMIYGKMIGDQPPGVMNVSVNKLLKCEGYPDVDTIVIQYRMHSGKRGDISFPGTGRTAYLPNTIEGNEVLNLLKQAFDRKLIFTIGRSVTTGRDNQIVWNGIHHKTNLSGGSAYFGYPDPTYFDRVKLELAAKGVF